jgi:hypothetical protein
MFSLVTRRFWGYREAVTTFRHRVTGPGSAGDIWVTTMHSSSANTLASVHTAWTTFVNSFLSGTLNAMWNTHMSATETITDQLDPVTGKNVAQSISSISQTGTGVGGSVSPRNCIVIGLRTTLPTRAGRGRMYWPSPDDSHYLTTGLFVSADVTTIDTGFATALTTFKATSQPVVYHRATKTFDSVVNSATSNVPGTQRRRTNKVTPTYATHSV